MKYGYAHWKDVNDYESLGNDGCSDCGHGNGVVLSTTPHVSTGWSKSTIGSCVDGVVSGWLPGSLVHVVDGISISVRPILVASDHDCVIGVLADYRPRIYTLV